MPRTIKHAAEKARSAYSINSDISTSIEFVNLSDEKIVVYWLDYDGVRQPYGELAPGQSYVQPTHLTHPWLITDAGGANSLLFYPDAQPRRVEIAFASKRKKAARSAKTKSVRR